MSEQRLDLGAAPSETVLPEDPPQQLAALAAARELAGSDRAAARAAAAAVVAANPASLAGWALLAELADDPVQAYACARVGYHRGLDALRRNGWRGTGYVRFAHRSNRGFLASLAALAVAAAALHEADEAERCALFLRQLDPLAPEPEAARHG